LKHNVAIGGEITKTANKTQNNTEAVTKAPECMGLTVKMQNSTE